MRMRVGRYCLVVLIIVAVSAVTVGISQTASLKPYISAKAPQAIVYITRQLNNTVATMLSRLESHETPERKDISAAADSVRLATLAELPPLAAEEVAAGSNETSSQRKPPRKAGGGLLGALQRWGSRGGGATVSVPAVSAEDAEPMPGPGEPPRSRYYSLGRVKPFTGDIELPGMLAAAAKARSYRGEIVLLTAAVYSNDKGENDELYLRWSTSAIVSLRNAGFEHYLLVMADKAGCAALKLLHPPAQCVWTSYNAAHPNTKQWGQPHGSVFWLWVMRWKVAAQLVAEGLNVMGSDLDVAFIHDPYLYLKAPPLSSYTLIMRQEPLYQTNSLDGTVNCGWAYVQNASRSGAAQWVLAETVRRIERWLNDPKGGQHERGFHGLYEQAIFSDVLRSAFAGRSMFREDIRYASHDNEDKWNKVGFRGAVSEEAVTWRRTDTKWPSPLPKCGLCRDAPPGFSPQPLTWHELRIATDADEAWNRRGGPVGLPEKDRRTPADGPWAPRLPALPRVPPGSWVETVLAAPAWLQTSWVEARELGYTGVTPAQAVMHHNVLVPNHATKRMTWRAWGFWPPEADARPPGVSTRFVAVVPETLVLALAPGLAVTAPSHAAHMARLRALIALAVASGRTPALPLVDCSSPWVGRSADPWWAYSQVEPNGPRDARVLVLGPLDAPTCVLLPAPLCDESAVHHPPDVDSFARALKEGGAATPPTVTLPKVLSLAAVNDAMAPHAGHRLVYLSSIPDGADGAPLVDELARQGDSVTAARHTTYVRILRACQLEPPVEKKAE